MLGKVKTWLGIEGVKLELVLPEAVQTLNGEGLLEGVIELRSMKPLTVTRLKVQLVERYSRGRRKEKLTDEYVLGLIELEHSIPIPTQEVVEIPFQLPFQLVDSDMQAFGNKNPITGGLVSALNWAGGVQSAFRVEAEAQVQGVALSPFDKKPLRVKQAK
jgi:hypothetical protein